MELIQYDKGIDVAKNLEAAGNALLSPPSNSQQLLPQLSEVEKYLKGVPQSPLKVVQSIINVAITTLTSKQLVNNEDQHVQVSIALCLTEIMRITAPDPPCDDQLIKDLFTLIVSAFDNISDISSSSYPKRVSILKYFAKLRLCNIMLDLKCDSLILRMFKHFLANIREHHPENVFMYMGLIMIRVLEEMDEIPLELLSTLLSYVRKGNQNVVPIAQKLSQRVMENSYKKLIPYMHQAVQYTGKPLEDYGRIVTVLCEQQAPLHHEVVASQNSLALQNKDDSTMLQWIGKKRRKSLKRQTHDMEEQEQLSLKVLPVTVDWNEHLNGYWNGVECSEEQKWCEEGEVALDKKQKVQELISISIEERVKIKSNGSSIH
ncbi:sister chromatid cohesion protein PDS5 homolog C-like [Euphorbia lathyris]|uniref:sister chromatid cohesion protein PDS5 homolog C-like n=1 Tax=Euphorbia lathyris TaxID=212925 RepID=UPI003313DD6C